MDLHQILHRLEGASGADRELDVLIWALLAEDRSVRWSNNLLLGRSCKPPHDECVLGAIDPGRIARNFSTGYSKPAWPELTASLDAALGLVERVCPEADFDICYRRGKFSHVLWCEPENNVWRRRENPLALLCALVKALIARDGDHKSSAMADSGNAS